jgi:hypothetical protein
VLGLRKVVLLTDFITVFDLGNYGSLLSSYYKLCTLFN